MKKSLLILSVLLCCLAIQVHAQVPVPRVEITKDQVKTLIGTTSDQFSVLGIHLGMTRAEAEAFLKTSKALVGEIDNYNLGRIYAYQRKADGTKGSDGLYLIWDGQKTMRRITVFEAFVPLLSANFKRLLSAEALDANSAFMRSFIGPSDSSRITLDVPSISLKHTTFSYDKIGIEITRKQSKDKESVVFALVTPK